MAKKKISENGGLIVDGRFFAQKTTGVQRAGAEILKSFDKMPGLNVIVALPPEASAPETGYENVKFVRLGKFKGNLWEQWSLPRYCKKVGLPLLCTGNIAPVMNKNYVIIHDVTFKEKHSYKEKKSWLRKIRFLTRAFIYKSKGLFTVSEFSADRIVFFYPHLKKRPTVVYPGYEHVVSWKEEEVEDMPEEFYFSVGTANPNKNFEYVIELARANPDKNFIIAGRPITKFTEYAQKNGVSNFRFLDYITDGQMAWLYRHCSGFIMPSLYEGFGLPPLEAVASGCRALYLSDIPVFREVYGEVAKFLDPTDYKNTVELDGKATMTEEQAEMLFEKCSWKKTAEKIAEVILDKNN